MGSPAKNKLFKILIGVKILVVGGIVVSMEDNFHVGDRPASAAPPQEEVTDTGAGSSQDGASGTPKDMQETPKASERRSFLANLLDLPKLDPDSIRKDELGRYLELAERKRRQVEERLDLLERREEQLKALERSIDDKLRKLEEERLFFAQTIQREKELKGKRIDKLIALYEKMEPKKAAPVIEQMDKDLVVELFKAIKQKQVTAILENMNPERSVEITEYFGRVRSGREYELLKEMNQSLRKEFEDCKGLPKEQK